MNSTLHPTAGATASPSAAETSSTLPSAHAITAEPAAASAPTAPGAGTAPVATPTAPASSPSAPAAAPPAPPPSPTQQIVTVLAPLRSSADGTHEVTIALQPDGLGNVKATVTVNAEQVVVQLSADNDQARDALRQALPLLRHELGGDGSAATVLMSNDGRSAPDQRANPTLSSPDGLASEENDDEPSLAAPVAGSPARHGHIDLHL